MLSTVHLMKYLPLSSEGAVNVTSVPESYVRVKLVSPSLFPFLSEGIAVMPTPVSGKD